MTVPNTVTHSLSPATGPWTQNTLHNNNNIGGSLNSLNGFNFNMHAHTVSVFYAPFKLRLAEPIFYVASTTDAY